MLDDDAENIRKSKVKLKNVFGRKLKGKVKRTELAYHWLHLKSPVEVSKDCPTTDSSSEIAHIVVFDIVAYSKQELKDQVGFAESLRARVDRSLESAGGGLKEDRERWYSPGGDVGALVFGSGSRGGARVAWTFAKMLQVQCADDVNIRIGIATGPVVVLPAMLPIGCGILEADHLSDLPNDGGLCCNRQFWEVML